MSGTVSSVERLQWAPIVEEAAVIAGSYDTAVSLRQVFYRLVAAGLIPNTTSAYKRLSALTAAARRDGWFSRLTDNTRSIASSWGFDSPAHARRYLRSVYRRDRTEGQDYQLWLVVEKRTFSAQLEAWFSDYGFPRVALAGYSSESLEADLMHNIDGDGRPAVILYAGDLDPSGEDILRNLKEQLRETDAKFSQVALTWSQVDTYALPAQPGKTTDSRSRGFADRHGRLIQVELEALDPRDLRELYWNAITRYWSQGPYDSVLEREEAERNRL